MQALSHSSRLVQNMNLVQAVAEAMDEAVDQNTTLCSGPRDEGRIQLRAHTSWREFGNRYVLTVPFALDAEARGALLFERPDGRGFDRRTSSCARAWRCWRAGCCTSGCARTACGARAATRCCAKRPLVRRALHRPQAAGAGGGGAGAVRRAAHGPIASARPPPCSVVQRAVAAPFEGYIAEATRRAGDEVRQGDVLAVLDTRETELELLRAGNLEVPPPGRGGHGARRQRRRRHRPGAGAPGHGQIQFYRQQIQRSSLRAPFDGVLVSGDLSQQLGEAVKRGQELFKLAAGRLPPVAGRGGSPDRRRGGGADRQVALAAMPDRQIPFTVTRIVPLAQVQEGKTVFRLEASLTPGESATLRPGMEGVGRIDIGERRYAWIWTHGFMDWLRLKWWAWFG